MTVNEQEQSIIEIWGEYQSKLAELKNLDVKLIGLLGEHYTDEKLESLGSMEKLEADLRSLLPGSMVGLGVRMVLRRARVFYDNIEKLNEQNKNKDGDKAEGRHC